MERIAGKIDSLDSFFPSPLKWIFPGNKSNQFRKIKSRHGISF